MSVSKIDLKNRWLAALLAYLIPGAGHFYQGRVFKGTIYSICILTTFLWGMELGEWQVVYFRSDPGNRTIGYLSQFFVGLPALPALLQAQRYEKLPANSHPDGATTDRVFALHEVISAPFHGQFVQTDGTTDGSNEKISGNIDLEPVAGDFGPDVKGVLRGKLNGNTPIELSLSGPIEIGRRVFASEGIPKSLILDAPPSTRPLVFSGSKRYLKCEVVDHDARFESGAGFIEGYIPRSFWNWFEVPLEDAGRQALHGRLGKYVELAQIFTWIAGLLNLLAIWDAFEGPAYGYGDELASRLTAEQDQSRKKEERTNKETEAAGGSAVPSTVPSAVSGEPPPGTKPPSHIAKN